ncbi:hypothetical protein HYV82_00735 [Candidatus Woesearchaeota archaeon]|nr:hypothetical protein [Candidatus Woesearchaeota archaeon]
MKGRKAAAGIAWGTLFKAIIGAIVLIVAIEIITGPSIANAKGIVNAISDVFPFGPKKECLDKGSHFWCEKAEKTEEHGKTVYKAGCLEWGKEGIKGAYCNPQSYKPVNYETGAYDICTEECVVKYCEAGLGRVNGKCVACRKLGESCGGGVWGLGNGGDCCAPELLKCEGEFLIQGTCKPKLAKK